MSFPKMLGVFAVVMFLVIGIAALVRHKDEPAVLEEVVEVVAMPEPVRVEPPVVEVAMVPGEEVSLPEANRMDEFFNVGLPRIPIVETITYSSRVPWQPGKSAWVADYAAHFGTSRHMIARSLNGEADYDSQKVANGDRFNVFKEGKPVSFHLVVDTSRSKMWVYYVDEEADQRVLVQTYDVGLGRPSERLQSGSLTPHGVYTLGDKIAVYRPGKFDSLNGKKTEMITVFGSRWIPFAEEVEGCTAPAKGLGLHGCPWNKVGEEWQEDASGLGAYQSDGCIRMKTEDVEELFAVIVTKPTKIYLVKDFFDARLPGTDVIE